jgi:hypothetical protein
LEKPPKWAVFRSSWTIDRLVTPVTAVRAALADTPLTVVLEPTRESEMNATFGRTCLMLGLLCLALATALSIEVKARHDGVTVQVRTASTMLLQAEPDGDENAAAPDDDESGKLASCTERDCPTTLKQELALARSDDRQPVEGKTFVIAGDEIRPKSKD